MRLKDAAAFPLLILLFIVLLEGFVTISVEVLVIRQLIPFVGNNVIVTSLIIGVFLLFLAIGYWRGGQYRSGYRHILLTNFTKAAICLGIGLSYAFTHLFFQATPTKFNNNKLVNTAPKNEPKVLRYNTFPLISPTVLPLNKPKFY